MELHVSLWDELSAFDFNYADLVPLAHAWPDVKLVHHTDEDSLKRDMHGIELLATWKFEPAWYERCPDLKAIFTPAAGTDWIAPDPSGRVEVYHGTFHGPMLAESLLGAILHMNRRMPALERQLALGNWDRDLQANTRLLRNQTIVIIGLGHIGLACARVLQQLGARVIGIKRKVSGHDHAGIPVCAVDEIQSALEAADHAVLLLPGGASTDRFMNLERLRQLKKGAFIYNFGRGNALVAEDLLPVLHDNHLSGAFLDVTEQEPLPADSPLWSEPDVVITPHSSCVYSEYKQLFIEELIQRLSPWVAAHIR